MDHAIEGLREYIRASAEMIATYPNNEEIKREMYAMVSAVNVLEIYAYGKHVTKYENIIGGIAK